MFFRYFFEMRYLNEIDIFKFNNHMSLPEYATKKNMGRASQINI